MNSPINLNWTIFKGIVDAKNLSIQWIDDGTQYHLYIFEALLVVNCFIIKNGSAEQLEFEANYKQGGNGTLRFPIVLKDGNNSISSTAISGKRGIDTNVINPITATLGRLTGSADATRTYVTINAENITSTTNLRTNTAGKTFWMTGYTISCTNTSLLAQARVIIRDSAANKVPFILPAGVLGLVTPGLSQATSMELNPMPFATNVTIAMLAGTVNASISVYGYEEAT